MTKINFYLKKNNVNTELQLKIRKYFEYQFKKQAEDDSQGQMLIKELSEDLKQEVLVDIYKKHLFKARFFREGMSQDCVNKMCLYVRE